jgi:arachidonate 15-lipoxygenase
LFKAIPLPSIAKDFHDDRVFAYMRVAGPNPVMLTRVDRLDERVPITAALFRSVLPHDSLGAALAGGRLYLADYGVLAGIEPGYVGGIRKHVFAPSALFAVDQVSGDLTPVSIRCDQASGPIFTPRDGYAWLAAKTIVQMADGNVHEAVTHLGRTHLFIGPFAIATERQLAANHPVRLLLRPHFEGTLAINDAAQSVLLAPGGSVDELLAGTIEETRGLAVEAVQSYPFAEAMLPAALQARGVDDRDLLPNYPYRDDALLYWDALHSWIRDYVTTYYGDDQMVGRDHELRAWQRELAAQDGGRVVGIGAIATVDDLVDALTLIVFTASVQHAAVNFPQHDHMSYAPNMPLAGFSPAPVSAGDLDEADYLAMLPPRYSATLQLSVTHLLGSIHYTTLGQYAANELCDPRLAAPLAAFRQQLGVIGRTIDARNRERRPYAFLMPRDVPQSINI